MSTPATRAASRKRACEPEATSSKRARVVANPPPPAADIALAISDALVGTEGEDSPDIRARIEAAAAAEDASSESEDDADADDDDDEESDVNWDSSIAESEDDEEDPPCDCYRLRTKRYDLDDASDIPDTHRPGACIKCGESYANGHSLGVICPACESSTPIVSYLMCIGKQCAELAERAEANDLTFTSPCLSAATCLGCHKPGLPSIGIGQLCADCTKLPLEPLLRPARKLLTALHHAVYPRAVESESDADMESEDESVASSGCVDPDDPDCECFTLSHNFQDFGPGDNFDEEEKPGTCVSCLRRRVGHSIGFSCGKCNQSRDDQTRLNDVITRIEAYHQHALDLRLPLTKECLRGGVCIGCHKLCTGSAEVGKACDACSERPPEELLRPARKLLVAFHRALHPHIRPHDGDDGEDGDDDGDDDLEENKSVATTDDEDEERGCNCYKLSAKCVGLPDTAFKSEEDRPGVCITCFEVRNGHGIGYLCRACDAIHTRNERQEDVVDRLMQAIGTLRGELLDKTDSGAQLDPCLGEGVCVGCHKAVPGRGPSVRKCAECAKLPPAKLIRPARKLLNAYHHAVYPRPTVEGSKATDDGPLCEDCSARKAKGECLQPDPDVYYVCPACIRLQSAATSEPSAACACASLTLADSSSICVCCDKPGPDGWLCAACKAAESNWYIRGAIAVVLGSMRECTPQGPATPPCVSGRVCAGCHEPLVSKILRNAWCRKCVTRPLDAVLPRAFQLMTAHARLLNREAYTQLLGPDVAAAMFPVAPAPAASAPVPASRVQALTWDKYGCLAGLAPTEEIPKACLECNDVGPDLARRCDVGGDSALVPFLDEVRARIRRGVTGLSEVYPTKEDIDRAYVRIVSSIRAITFDPKARTAKLYFDSAFEAFDARIGVSWPELRFIPDAATTEAATGFSDESRANAPSTPTQPLSHLPY